MRKIFAVSGIRDVLAKQHGAPNMITNARVTLKALKSLKPTSLNTSFGMKKSIETDVSATEESEKKSSPKKVSAKKKEEETVETVQ